MFYKCKNKNAMTDRFYNVFKSFLILLFMLLGSNACKDSNNSLVPFVEVTMNINPANYIELNIPGGVAYFPNEGYGGVLIVNNWGDDLNPYLAFDACCTKELSADVHVEVGENGSGYVVCPECGSKFMVFGSAGLPIKGPATRPLKQYRAVSANGRIIVTN